MQYHTNAKSTNINTEMTMYKVEIYSRDKNGNRGALMSTAKYPTKEQAERAKSALIWLCKNQFKFPKQWNLNIKKVVIV